MQTPPRPVGKGPGGSRGELVKQRTASLLQDREVNAAEEMLKADTQKELAESIRTSLKRRIERLEQSGLPTSGRVVGTDVPPPQSLALDGGLTSESAELNVKSGVEGYEKPNKASEEEFTSLGGELDSYYTKGLEPEYEENERKGYDKQTGRATAVGSGKAKLVKYIDESKRAKYELKLQKGTNLFYWRGKPLDTTQMKRRTAFGGTVGTPRVIFVMTDSGKVYVADEGHETTKGLQDPDDEWRFNHSSLVEGEPIAAAGELWFEEGVLVGVSDKSGHYKPGLVHTVQVLRVFKSLGIDVGRVIVERIGKEQPVHADALLESGGAQLAMTLLRQFGTTVDGAPDDAADLLRQAYALAPKLLDYTPFARRLVLGANETLLQLKTELHDQDRRVAAREARSARAIFEVLGLVDSSLIPKDGVKLVDDVLRHIDNREWAAATEKANAVSTQVPTVDQAKTDLTLTIGEKLAGVGARGRELDQLDQLLLTTRNDVQQYFNKPDYTQAKKLIDSMGASGPVFISAIRSALHQLKKSNDDLATLLITDAKSAYPPVAREYYKLANAVKPGSVEPEKFVNPMISTLGKIFAKYDRGREEIGRVAYGFWADWHDNPSDAKDALNTLLRARGLAMTKFVDDFLITGADALMNKAEYRDAGKVLNMAISLCGDSTKKKQLKMRRTEAKRLREEAASDDD